MQEEYKIKENNNKLTSEKLKRKVEESNNKILELNKIIEDLTQKNNLIRSNSTNIMKINNTGNYPNLGGNSDGSNNIQGNSRRIINYNEANSINNINNSTNISHSNQGYMSKNIEELNSNKTNKSMNLQLNGLSGNNLNNILNNSNIINHNTTNQNKTKYNSQRISEDLNKIITKQISKKDSKENNIGNNNISNKSIEFNKKINFENDKIKQNTSINNIISEGNLIDINNNPFDDGIYDLVFLEKYHPRNDLKNDVINIENFPDGKIVKFYENDKREVIFPSGVRKEIFSDGYQIVYFNNKDIKQVKINFFIFT